MKQYLYINFPRFCFPFMVVLLALISSPQLHAQTLVCTANTAEPPLLASNEISARAAEIVMTCRGGTPTPAGSPIPDVDIEIETEVSFTSRLLAPAQPSEALLLIDEPLPEQQVVCLTPHAGCIPQLSGAAGPNVYPGFVAGSLIRFTKIPFDPPGSGTRVFRFVNLRVNASLRPILDPLVLPQLHASIRILRWTGIPSVAMPLLDCKVATRRLTSNAELVLRFKVST